MKILLVLVFAFVASLSFAQQHPQAEKEGWYKMDVGTKEGFFRVQFFSRTHGWICGDNAYHTTDGGDTWTPFIPPSGYKYIYFMDDSTGFANGTTEDGKHSTIRRTTDRGQTWSDPFWYPELGYQKDLTHVGDTVFLLNDANLLRSIDRGETWENFEVPFSGNRSISFADSKNGYAVGTLIDFPSYAGFAFTTNGGKNWIEMVSRIDQNLYGVHAISKDKVFAVGALEGIYWTTNQGDTWDSIPYQPTISVYLDIHFVNSLCGYIVGSKGLIRRTTDGGKTWEYQESRVQFLKDTNANIYLHSVTFIDSLYGWSVGDNGIALRTKTGGFTTQGIVESKLLSIPTQVFPEPNNGITRIRYSLPEPQNIMLTLHSMSGQLVKSIPAQYQLSGENEILLDLADLASGIYQYVLGSERFSATGQLSIVK
jgi:photosystem II stability/assembly factor-like uncharacterized protein